ncbi:glycosyltransferase family protein [Microbacterium thalli]|uniref:glycosyltransferase family protein n=1 Tax=Microbacterium thalli TaxID=3027921 RepID=UPI002365E612|nr:glycosyltransferase [Microbacterium thalli]MDD7930473.1 glycosyltransferase [Microbacterium thalli]
MLRHARAVWRGMRRASAVRPVMEAVDRAWWAHTIRRAHVVDIDFVVGQGGPASVRRAVRRYVRAGFRDGMSLNPLFMERLVASQLPDAGRVPALYAYLVNDPRSVAVSVNWDAPGYVERHPESADEPGGPLGHAWRAARAEGSVMLGSSPALQQRVAWSDVLTAARCAPAAEPALSDTRIVYVCRLADDEGIPARPLMEAAKLAEEPDVATVIALNSAGGEARIASCILALWLPRTQIVRDQPHLLDRIARSRAATVVVRGPHAEIDAEALATLADEGRNGPVAPLWLGWDGTVASAGVVVHEGRPQHLLRDHPAEDALALGAVLDVASVAGETYAAPATSPASGARTLTGVVVRAPVIRTGVVESSAVAGGADMATLVARAGLRVEPGTAGSPTLSRAPRTAETEDGETVPCLRWAIKIAAPPGKPGESWGDTHFARGLAEALRRLGQEVVIDAYDARMRSTGYLDDVVLALRGPEPFRGQRGALSLLWVISHPDEIEYDELSSFDKVFAASEAWARNTERRFGVTVTPLLQCTDARRFLPAGLPRTDRLVFIGTARGIARPSVVEPIRAGIPIDVYGPDWRGYIPAASIVATGVPNSALPPLYESARAVMNDHWPAMQRHGFVSNRLFDVVAAGGRAVSDTVAGIDDLFGGAVVTYESVPELISLLRTDLDTIFPSPERLREVASQVRVHHSFDARARTLLRTAIELRQ